MCGRVTDREHEFNINLITTSSLFTFKPYQRATIAGTVDMVRLNIIELTNKSMNYEIRGLLEESSEVLLKATASRVAREPTYWNLPDEVKNQIAFDLAYSRFMGFHSLWCMVEGREPEDGYTEDVAQLVSKNMDALIYNIDRFEEEVKSEHVDKSEIPDYDIDMND
jgi:hypothetical protein